MKILMVGLGAIGQRHLRNARALLGDEAEFLAYRARRLSRTLTETMEAHDDVDVEREFGVRVLATLDEALAEKPDLVFISNPTSLHLETARRVAEAGCAMLLEKPLAENLDGVDALLEIAEAKNLVAAVGYQMRFHPCWKQARAWLNNDEIGAPLTASFRAGEYLPGWHPYEDYRASYAARRELGGGVILTQIHELDLALWLFGAPRQVFALGGKWSELEIDVEDCASILLHCEYSRGEKSRGEKLPRALPIYIQQDYVCDPPQRGAQIIGARGRIEIDARHFSATLFQNGIETRRDFSDVSRNELFLEQTRALLQVVRGEKQFDDTPLVSLRDGARSLRLALLAKRSIKSGALESFS